MMQHLLFMLYVLVNLGSAQFYLHTLQKRSCRRMVQILVFALCAATGIVALSLQGSLWQFYIPLFFVVFIYVYISYQVTLSHALLLGIILFLATDSIPRLIQHVVLQQFDNYMILSATHPLLAFAFCIACLLINAVSLSLMRRFMPPESSRQFTAIKLLFAVFILLPVLYMGNIQHFLPINGCQTPLNVSVIRIVLCYFGLVAVAAIGYGLQFRETQQESQFIRRLMKEHHEQHMLRKETIEEINRECHDLKHQLALMHSAKDTELRAEYTRKMEEITTRYENLVQTGNSVLDLILTEKQTLCSKREISLTYMVDPEPLDTLSAMDLCTVFDNALDNAIEAVSSIQDKEKRLINLYVSQKGKLLYILVENYYEHSLHWKDGELITTKANRSYHGYGLKSIRYAVTQYNGETNIHTEDNWFKLSIVIPLGEPNIVHT